MTMHGTEGPALITFHGGGIVNGSRRDDYVPKPITSVSLQFSFGLAIGKLQLAVFSRTT
jgi:hypothetical protein